MNSLTLLSLLENHMIHVDIYLINIIYYISFCFHYSLVFVDNRAAGEIMQV
jgi:hypothetical protein